MGDVISETGHGELLWWPAVERAIVAIAKALAHQNDVKLRRMWTQAAFVELRLEALSVV